MFDFFLYQVQLSHQFYRFYRLLLFGRSDPCGNYRILTCHFVFVLVLRFRVVNFHINSSFIFPFSLHFLLLLSSLCRPLFLTLFSICLRKTFPWFGWSLFLIFCCSSQCHGQKLISSMFFFPFPLCLALMFFLSLGRHPRPCCDLVSQDRVLHLGLCPILLLKNVSSSMLFLVIGCFLSDSTFTTLSVFFFFLCLGVCNGNITCLLLGGRFSDSNLPLLSVSETLFFFFLSNTRTHSC